tara:strand:- start:73 stop:762 length:690 start_codon:yes stop_codon:yes gene_type:complete
MDKIEKVRSISIWVFIIPFIALNLCLILITQFHELFPNKLHVIHNTIPYIDGGASISRTARVFPTYLIFKPAMFFTSYLLVKYWLYSKDIIQYFNKSEKNIKYILFFGIGSAVLLTLHSIFLGIKFDNDLYKLFRRIVMLCFIIFEVTAQAYLVITYYSLKNDLFKFINKKILKIKLILVSTLVIVAIISIPIVTMPGNKAFKHALEWDYFIGVISFYLLTFFMWKKNN